ncbi:MAG: DNA double-strand break repair nuclease NurA [Sulfolobales archaeon]
MATPELLHSVERIRAKISETLKRYGLLYFSREISWYSSTDSIKGLAIGVDSSYTSKVFKYIYLYIIRGVAVPRGDDELYRRCIRSDSYGDAHFIATPVPEGGSLKSEGSVPMPAKELKKILSHRARDLEVRVGWEAFKCSEESFGEKPLILLDGSARGFLPYRFKGSAEDNSGLVSSLRDSWEKRLETLKRLSLDRKIAFIAKTTYRTYLSAKVRPYIKRSEGDARIEVLVPDVVLLDLLLTRKGIFKDGVRTPGFTEPLLYENNDPKVYITIFYAAFERGGGLYQVSLLGDYTGDVDFVREVFARIRYHSAGGYPEPLRQAHHYAKISYSDFNKLLHAYGVYLETGREVLEL